MLNGIHHIIATLGFIGYLPYAPGTFGSAAACLLMMLFRPADSLLFIATPLLFTVGTISSHQCEKVIGKDSGHIVIDEFCGYLISILFIPKSINYLVAAFILFRIFDIVKPPPVRQAEKAVTGGAGVMLDDVLAGVYANICLQVWRLIF